MIDQGRAEKATEFLIESAAEYGEARGQAIWRSNMLRRVKAIMMKQSGETSVAAQEREAYSSDEYEHALLKERDAVTVAETLRAKRDAAKATIETWRSANANLRSAERGPSMGGGS